MESINTLTYRPYEKKDLPGLLKLWREHSGWGAIDEAQFRQWCRTPHGEALVMVAIDEDEAVMGQSVFFPAKMLVDGREIMAVRLLAPIIHPDIRQVNFRNPHHPAVCLYRYGFEEALRRGFSLCYSFPAFGWISLMQIFPYLGLPPAETEVYSCREIPLTGPQLPLPETSGLEIKLSAGLTEEYSRLWEEAVAQFPIRTGLVRDVARQAWKWGDDYLLEARSREDGALVGYVVIKKDNGLLADALARTEEQLRAVLQAAILAIRQDEPDSIPLPFETIKFMNSPLMEAATQRLETRPVDYNFAFGCGFLNSDTDNQPIEPSKWYMMPDV